MGTTLEDIREIIRDLGKAQKKTQESLQETQKSMRESQEKTTQKSMREAQEKTQKSLREAQRETEVSLRKLSKELAQTNGNFLESFVQGDLVTPLRKWGIEVHHVQPRVGFVNPDGTKGIEYDLVAINGREVVVVEVKTTLTTDMVDIFVGKLKKFKSQYQEYANNTLYGGMAYLGETDDSPKAYAEKKGLFLFQALGGRDDVTIISNKKNFKPQTF